MSSSNALLTTTSRKVTPLTFNYEKASLWGSQRGVFVSVTTPMHCVRLDVANVMITQIVRTKTVYGAKAVYVCTRKCGYLSGLSRQRRRRSTRARLRLRLAAMLVSPAEVSRGESLGRGAPASVGHSRRLTGRGGVTSLNKQPPEHHHGLPHGSTQVILGNVRMNT